MWSIQVCRRFCPGDKFLQHIQMLGQIRQPLIHNVGLSCCNWRSKLQIMNRTIQFIIMFLGALTIASCKDVEHVPTPAFDQAQGSGAAAFGGRGGRVIEVTNLSDSGPGSFRACVDASGPRTCIFRVAGYISLNSALQFKNPDITVAGQTAPFGGITLRSGSNLKETGIQIQTHNVIIRYLRIRLGKAASIDGMSDALGLRHGANHVILDHISLSWASDEIISGWTKGELYKNITVSNSIIAEALNHHDHGLASLWGASEISKDQCTDVGPVDLFRNLIMSAKYRMFKLKIGQQRMINNIIYNWESMATMLRGGVHVDIISNLFKPGPNTILKRREIVLRRDSMADINDVWSCKYGPERMPSIHIAGNKGPHQHNPYADNWNMMEELTNSWNTSSGNVSRQYESKTPIFNSIHPIRVIDVNKIEEKLLDDIGASHRLDESGTWVANRDAVDIRLVEEYRQGKGQIPLTEDSVGGYVEIVAGNSYADSDHDGMSDRWELAWGLDPNKATDRNADPDDDGYTNLEEFLNGTRPAPPTASLAAISR